MIAFSFVTGKCPAIRMLTRMHYGDVPSKMCVIVDEYETITVGLWLISITSEFRLARTCFLYWRQNTCEFHYMSLFNAFCYCTKLTVAPQYVECWSLRYDCVVLSCVGWGLATGRYSFQGIIFTDHQNVRGPRRTHAHTHTHTHTPVTP